MNSYQRVVPAIYYLLSALIGVAAAICLNVWFSQYTLFFGTHTFSSATIIVSGLLCLAIGSYIFGKLADRAANRMNIFIIFSVIIGLYALLHPIIFQGIKGIFLSMNRKLAPGLFGVELLRLVLTFIILIIPVGMMAGLTPLLIKHFIRQVGQAGRFMSVTIFAGSSGILTGQLLSSFLLIPKFGVKTTLILGALIQLSTAALAVGFVFINRSKPLKRHIQAKSDRPKGSTLKFKKKKTVLESGAKLKRAMIRVYTFQGFAITAMLLICIRILAGYSIVTPAYFYAVVLSLVFAGLAVGSSLYKRISEKPVNKFMTLATLQIMTGFGAVLSYVMMNILANTINQPVHELTSFAHIVFQQSLLFATLLFLPAVLTGLSLPLVGKLYPRRLQKTGSDFGYLGSIIFINAAAGIIIVLFVLIPLIGLSYAYLFFVILTILSGIYLIFRDSRLMRGFRLSYAFSAILLFIFMTGVFRIFNLKQSVSSDEKNIEGSAASISATKHPNGTRSVFLNGKYYFGSDVNSMKAQQLTAYLPFLINQHIHSALVIGFGTGLTASKLEECGVASIQITDIFPEIIRLSSDVFADENNDIMTNSHTDISIEGARSYLIRSEEKIDLITSGINHLREMPDIYTKDFYQICYNKLSDQGLFCQILPTVDITEIELRSVMKSCAGAFPNIRLWYISSESILMLASKKQDKIKLCSLSSAFSVVNANQSLSINSIPDVESLLAQVVTDDKKLRSLIGDAPENSDNNPLVEFYRETTVKPGKKLLSFLVTTQPDYGQLIDMQENCLINTSEALRQIKRLNQSLLQQAGLSSGLQQ